MLAQRFPAFKYLPASQAGMNVMYTVEMFPSVVVLLALLRYAAKSDGKVGGRGGGALTSNAMSCQTQVPGKTC